MGTQLTSKYSQKLLNSAKKSTTDAIKTASKVADKIASVSKKSSERFISPEKRQKIID